VRDANHEYLQSLPDEVLREDALAELSVKQQVRNLIDTTIIQDAWKSDRRPSIHGWIYGLQDGLLKPLMMVDPAPVEAAYKIL
jgi:carbonic anhydrase